MDGKAQKMKKIMFLTIAILTLYMSMTVVAPLMADEDEKDGPQIFPLPILDRLPSENRYFYPGLDKCCKKDGIGIFGDRIVENPYRIKLPNGF